MTGSAVRSEVVRLPVSELRLAQDGCEGWGYRGDLTVRDSARRLVLVRAARSNSQESCRHAIS